MKELVSQDLASITEASSTPMISIYLSKENEALDMKSLNEKWNESLKKVENLLLKDYAPSFVKTFMKPLWGENCIQALKHLDKGLIVFYSAAEKGYLKVQTAINDLVVVADSFHIKPLLRIKNTQRGFFLVSVSAKAINVSVETNGHLYRFDSFRNEIIEENSSKITRTDPRDFITTSAIELNKLLAAYKLPIILAGVREHVGHIRKVLEHCMLLPDSIVGNVERLRTDELRKKCFDLLGPFYLKNEREAMSELELAVKRNHAITYIEEIALSAIYGKIKKLFVIENRQIWGTINKSTGEIFISPHQLNSHDDDILDDICQIVLNKGGEVVVLKDSVEVNGYLAAAIVTDRSLLYDFNQSSYYSISG